MQLLVTTNIIVLKLHQIPATLLAKVEGNDKSRKERASLRIPWEIMVDSRATTASPLDRASLTSGESFTKPWTPDKINKYILLKKKKTMNERNTKEFDFTLGLKWLWRLDNLERAFDAISARILSVFRELQSIGFYGFDFTVWLVKVSWRLGLITTIPWGFSKISQQLQE